MATIARTYPSLTGDSQITHCSFNRSVGIGPTSVVLSFNSDVECISFLRLSGMCELPDTDQIVTFAAIRQNVRVATDPDVFVPIKPESPSGCDNVEEFYNTGVYDRAGVLQLAPIDVEAYYLTALEINGVTTGRQGAANDLVVFAQNDVRRVVVPAPINASPCTPS